MVFWVDVLLRLQRQSRFCMLLLEALHVALLLLDYRVISPFFGPCGISYPGSRRFLLHNMGYEGGARVWDLGIERLGEASQCLETAASRPRNRTCWGVAGKLCT